MNRDRTVARRERLLDLKEIAASILDGEAWSVDRIAVFKGYDGAHSLRQAERRYSEIEAIATGIGSPIRRVEPAPGARWLIAADDLHGLLTAVERELELIARHERHEGLQNPRRRPCDQRKIDTALRIRAERVFAGLCATQGCQCLAQDGTLFCRRCRAIQSGQTKARRDRLKGLGICTVCGREAVVEKGGILGPACSKKQRTYLAEYVAERAGNGLCKKCGVGKPEADKATCEACLRISRTKQTTDEFRKRRREIKAERRANGLCACCDEKAVEKKTLCRKHLDYARDKQAEYKRTQRGEEHQPRVGRHDDGESE
jgi:hypothetical protein